jgi:tRNA-2-methylthio-N6-dimethylallyladenosine synthase
VGRRVEVLVSEGEGRKDAGTGRRTGRARDGRLVHLDVSSLGSGDGVRPGDVLDTVITYAAPHHLVADGPVLGHRATRAGDRWQEGRQPSRPVVGLGLPTVGVPASR